MKKQDLLEHLVYLYERAKNPTYNQLEAGFRHNPLLPKEIQKRKDDCLEDISRDLLFLIDTLNKENIE